MSTTPAGQGGVARLNPIRLGYFAFFLGLGIYLPYFSPYLIEQGFAPDTVGAMLAMVMAAKLVAPPLLGWMVDHSGRVIVWLIATALISAVLAVGLALLAGIDAGLVGWMVLLVLFGFFWQPLLSQLDVAALRLTGPAPERYPALRAWGSIGFIVASVGLGALIDRIGLDAVPWLMAVALVALAVVLWRVPEPGVPRETGARPVSIRDRLKEPAMLAFFAGSFLINLSHGVYYAFFSVHLADLGYSATAIGLLWALGVVAEIVLFFLLPGLRNRFAPLFLMLLAIALMALRWLLIGYQADVLGWLLFAQLLHAASFGMTHAVGIWVIDHQFPGRAHARGQAILSAASYGGGAALGLYLAGLLWGRVEPDMAFAAMTLASLLAFALMLAARRVVRWSPGEREMA
ncbi:MFS transporter [Guyparkeria sp. SCN-R1]|uniref:MFS transporter n=1 Tax=Guyparkeria sp. SCN-R1 TaxID=2341113 RepID=UPI000F654BCD|nr:MFS transporter [Guyparkeria sp. SCN-R1]RRQ24711.1 MFS transporter [Guyparkeria sp. SCN-R1]